MRVFIELMAGTSKQQSIVALYLTYEVDEQGGLQMFEALYNNEEVVSNSRKVLNVHDRPKRS